MVPTRLVQFLDTTGKRSVAAVTEDGRAWLVRGADSVYELAAYAGAAGKSLRETLMTFGFGEPVDIPTVLREGRALPPIDHPDPAHLLVTGTSLTSCGSIQWFYKGDGSTVVPPGGPITSWQLDAPVSTEPELAGVYVIGEDGSPLRVGFALANGLCDDQASVQSRDAGLPSQVRQSSFGPEILIGLPPREVRGYARVRRNEEIIYENRFLSGEGNMVRATHSLEVDHFRHESFRRPGDIHIHCFAVAPQPRADAVQLEPDDLCEIEAEPFAFPLSIRVGAVAAEPPAVRSL